MTYVLLTSGWERKDCSQVGRLRSCSTPELRSWPPGRQEAMPAVLAAAISTASPRLEWVRALYLATQGLLCHRCLLSDVTVPT